MLLLKSLINIIKMTNQLMPSFLVFEKKLEKNIGHEREEFGISLCVLIILRNI